MHDGQDAWQAEGAPLAAEGTRKTADQRSEMAVRCCLTVEITRGPAVAAAVAAAVVVVVAGGVDADGKSRRAAVAGVDADGKGRRVLQSAVASAAEAVPQPVRSNATSLQVSAAAAAAVLTAT